MNFDVFSKSYDFRGIFGEDFSAEDYVGIGFAFASLFPGEKFAVGRDARISSGELADRLLRGIALAGKTGVDLGLVSSDMLQYATIAHTDIDAGLMVTASHNPKEYNGLKSCLKNAKPVNLKEWGPKIRTFLESRPIPETASGSVEARDFSNDWIEAVASYFDEDFSGLKVVADAGNGAAGAFVEKLAKRLGIELTGLYLEPDGNFPNHHPSPIESKNTRDLVAKVRELGAAVGVAFDGDADRAVLCDDTGEIVGAGVVTSAIAEAALAKHPGSTVLLNAVSTDAAKETVLRCGGKLRRSLVGHVYLKEIMREDPSIFFAGEHSGHYYFRDFGNIDSGALAFVSFLAIMRKKGLRASELRASYETSFPIEETNFRVRDVAEAVAKIEAAYPDAEYDRFDGLTLRYPDFWFNVRPSSNEPLLRLNLEAKTPEIRDREFERAVAVLSS